MTIISHELLFTINEAAPIFFMASYESLTSIDKFKQVPNNGTIEEHYCTCDLFQIRDGNIEDRRLLQRSYLATAFDLHYSLALILGLPQYHRSEKSLLISIPHQKTNNGLWRSF